VLHALRHLYASERTAEGMHIVNTHDRDYADLQQLITRHHLDGNELTTALRNTADHRGSGYAHSAKRSPTCRPDVKRPTPHGGDAKPMRPRVTPNPWPVPSPP
jgi:hypothetical protein